MSGTLEKYFDLIRRVAHDEEGSIDEMLNFPATVKDDPVMAELTENINLIFLREDVYEHQLVVAKEIKENLEELNKLKNRHLGIAAHDLRSPLSSLYSAGDLLLKYDLSEEKRKKLYQSICMISDQTLTLVNDLLDLVAIERDSFHLNFDAVNLTNLTLERVEMMKPMASSLGIELIDDLHPVPDCALDQMRMRQVIDNLLSNAIKFSSSGDVIVVACQEKDDWVCITVDDQGSGMPTEQAEQMFEEFKVGNNKAIRGEKRTGLGLSIVKNIVEAHGGKIEVESAPGKGTTFTVRILSKGAA